MRRELGWLDQLQPGNMGASNDFWIAYHLNARPTVAKSSTASKTGLLSRFSNRRFLCEARAAHSAFGASLPLEKGTSTLSPAVQDRESITGGALKILPPIGGNFGRFAHGIFVSYISMGGGSKSDPAVFVGHANGLKPVMCAQSVGNAPEVGMHGIERLAEVVRQRLAPDTPGVNAGLQQENQRRR